MSVLGTTANQELAHGRSETYAALCDSQRLNTMMMKDMRTLKGQVCVHVWLSLSLSLFISLSLFLSLSIFIFVCHGHFSLQDT